MRWSPRPVPPLGRLAVVTVLAVLAASAPVARATGDAYVVGPGDVLSVGIRAGGGVEPLDLELTVAGDGSIDVVHVGPVRVGGLTTTGIRDRIRRRLVEGGIFREPSVSVNVREYRSQAVNVSGLVTTPGRYYLRGPTLLLDILSEAGGVVEGQSADGVQILRPGRAEPLIVRRSVLLGPDLEAARRANVPVLAGDTVYVPPKAEFCITGPVEEPGCYPMDSGMTVLEAIALGRGFRQSAAGTVREITIRRRSGLRIVVDLAAIERGELEPPLLEADDQVLVPEATRTRFCVMGAVNNPDCYDHERGLTLEEAISKAGGLVVERADRHDILVRRQTSAEVAEFHADLDDPSSRGARFPIEEGDQIVIAEAQLWVTVEGTVAEPGRVDWSPGLTISDAIAEAGGPHGQHFDGNLKRVLIRRGEERIQVNVRRIQQGRANDVPLQPGDRIFVPKKLW